VVTLAVVAWVVAAGLKVLLAVVVALVVALVDAATGRAGAGCTGTVVPVRVTRWGISPR
jgi:hypothetical protein